MGRALDEWAFRNRVKLYFIEPGKLLTKGHPQNAVIEAFTGKMRAEGLNQEWYTDLNETPIGIEKWRDDYNVFRPQRPG